MPEEQYAQTRKYSIKEGAAASVAGGAGESYIVPYALALGSSNAQIGFLSSFPGIIGPLSQIYGSKLIEKHERRSLVLLFVALQASMWLLFVLAGVLFLYNFSPDYIVPFLIISYIFYAMFGSLAGPAWFSLMGDVVPEKMRGSYFSKRNKISGIISMVVTLLAALWLEYTKQTNIVIIGFIVLFAISALGRFTS